MRTSRSMIAGVIVSAGLAWTQTVINGGRTIKGPWDASEATSTIPARTGDTLPSACSSGEMFFLRTAAAGKNLYLCQPANTWTQTAEGAGTAGAALTTQSNTFAPGTTQTIQGILDASGASATLPAAVGGSLPGTCRTGQVHVRTGGNSARMMYVCSATNTWTQTAYAQGTTAQRPSACVVGDLYFATDATAGQNLNLCTAANTWTQITGGSGSGLTGSGAANQMAYFSSSTGLTSDNKVTRNANGDLTATSFYTGGPASMSGYAVNAGWRLQINSSDSVTCSGGAATLNGYMSYHRVALNNQPTCAITLGTTASAGTWATVLVCQGATTATSALTWSGAKGGMGSGGATGQCAAQTFLYDSVNNLWYATSGGTTWN